MPESLRQKWRPRLWYVVLLVLGLVLCLPFAGLFIFQFFASQLVQQTEENLLGQASVLAATYAALYTEIAPLDITGLTRAPAPEVSRTDGYAPVFPALSLGKGAILPPRPDATAITTPPAAHYLEIGQVLSAISSSAQRQSLVGYRLLDNLGNVIGGSAETGLSLAEVAEVKAALEGQISTVARQRIRETPEPLIYRLSTGTRVRVFVAMPVVVAEHVVGVVYLNRTPNHIFRFLYGERLGLLKAAVFVLLATGLIGLVFWRFITRPIHALISRTEEIDQSGRPDWAPLDHFGTREIENLSHSFEAMTKSLQNRQNALNTYTAHVTHELKSPLTSVQGAAELLRDAGAGMSAAQRQKFLENIMADTSRMEGLLKSMRNYAQAEQPLPVGTCTLADMKTGLGLSGVRIEIVNETTPLPIHPKTLTIILKHLLENAKAHGASAVTLTVGQGFLEVSDNGSGISAGNRDKIMAPFFTTRRENGGTGMGLSIVASMLATLGGRIELTDQTKGTGFWISFERD